MSKFNSWPEVVEQIPDYALLMLPPFPTNLTVKSLRQWSKPGIWSTVGDHVPLFPHHVVANIRDSRCRRLTVRLRVRLLWPKTLMTTILLT